MASRSDIEAGSAYVRITAKDETPGVVERITKKLMSFAAVAGSVVTSAMSGLASNVDVVVGAVTALGARFGFLVPIISAVGRGLLAFASAHPVITAITVALSALYLAGSILQPIIYALSLAFNALMLPINLVIGALQKCWQAFNATIGFGVRLATALPRAIVSGFVAIGRAANAMQKAVVMSVINTGAAIARAGAYVVSEGLKLGSKVAQTVASAIVRAAINPGKVLVQPIVDALASAATAIQSRLSAIGDYFSSLGASVSIAGAKIAGVGALVVVPLSAAAKEFADFGASTAKNASQFNLAAEEMSGLEYASRRLGASLEDLQAVQDGKTKDGIAAIVAEGKALGNVLDAAQVAEAKALRTEFDKLKAGMLGVALQAGSIVAPAIREVTERSVAAVKIVISWVKNNKELIATAFRIGSIIATVGGVIATVGGVISAAGTAFAGLAAIAGVIASTITVVGGTVAAILTPMAALVAILSVAGVAFVGWLNPIAMVRDGLSGLSPYLDSIAAKSKSSIAVAIRVFGELRDFVGGVMDGINNAILAGSPEKAFAVVTSALKVTWVRSLTELQAITGTMFGGLFSALAGGDFAEAGNQISAVLRLAFAKGLQYVLPLWTDIQNAADTALTYIQMAWNTSIEAMGSWLKTSMKDAWSAVKTFAADSIKWIGTRLVDLLDSVAALDITGKAAAALAKARQAMTASTGATGGPAQTAEEKNKALRDALAGRVSGRNEALGASQEASRQQIADATAVRNRDAAGASAVLGVVLDGLRDDLEKAQQEAKAARDAVKPVADIAIPPAQKEEIKKQAEAAKAKTFGTFSAAAAMAAGTKYNSPAERMAKDVAAQKKLQEDQLKVAEKTRDLIDKLQLQWTA